MARSPLEIIRSMSQGGSLTGIQGGRPELSADERLTPDKGAEALAELRKNGFNGRPIEEWLAQLKEHLAAHPEGQPLYVFGYGSLMWNPMIPHQGLLPARIETFARSFCMNVVFGRGSEDHPGLMLALDEIEDNTVPCWGRLVCVRPEDVEHAYTLLWIREMGGDGYVFREIEAHTDQGPLSAITFTVNRAGERYLGHLPLDVQAARIAHATGILGTNYDYLKNLMEEMAKLGIEDPYLNTLWDEVRFLRGESRPFG